MAAVNARLGGFLVLVAAVACRDVQLGLSPGEITTIRRYLDCVDCVVLLDSLRALADRKPDPTVDSLNSGLRLGPGLRAIAAAESALAIGFVRDSTWRSQNNLGPLPIDYIGQARDRYVNGYRSRGAYGLGWIHTPRAVAYLDSAAQMSLPPSVMRAVIYARDSLPPR